MDLISFERLFLVLSGYFCCKLLNTGKKKKYNKAVSLQGRPRPLGRGDRLMEVKITVISGK